MKWFVEIVEYETKKVVKQIECSSEFEADKVDSGVNISLNHDRYYTRITTDEKGDLP